ncbi:ethanolamine kinase 2-like [Lineus longissimus]|uniref:ethanolamine kinase 2-like n=1 Tax=Lineus longissimus TaxID=88925 RepID=UPI00315D746D
MTLKGLRGCHADIFINPENVEREAQQMIRMVRKHWQAEDVQFERCTMSFVNRVYKAYVPDSEDALIFRVYPRGQFDSAADKLQEQQITCLLSELKICPRVNCIFQNGVCFDHVGGDILDWTDFSPLDDVCFAKCCVRELASFHSNKTRDLAISKYGIKEKNIMPDFFKSMLKLHPQKLPTMEEEILKRQAGDIYRSNW